MWIINHHDGSAIREMTEAEEELYARAVAELPVYEREVGAVDASLIGLSDSSYPAGVYGEE